MAKSYIVTHFLLGILIVGCVAGTVLLNLAWTFLVLLTVLTFWVGGKIKKPFTQNLAFSLAVFFVCLTIAEIVFHILAAMKDEPQILYSGDYYREDPDLGYGPNPGIYTVKKVFKNEVVYDQTYTISDKLIRQLPELINPQGCPVAFFGGSITFGEGVGDKENMPYYFHEASNGKFSVYNFGFHGYGPHQMLRTLETSPFSTTVKQPVTLVVYQGIETHVDRAAGKASWDLFGPSYRIMNDDSLQYVGPFHHQTFKQINQVLQYSFLFVYVRNGLIRTGAMSPSLIEPYVRILRKVRQMVEESFGGKFIVLFWDKGSGSSLAPKIYEELQAEQFHVIPISEIIPDIENNSQMYTLSPYDPHPSPLVHRRIGVYLAQQFQGMSCS